jgi:hypothetical protein
MRISATRRLIGGIPARLPIRGTLLYLLAILLLAGSAHADILNHQFTISYEVSRNGIYLGDSLRRYRLEADGNWKYRAVTRASGLAKLFFSDTIVETSILKKTATRIIPLSYHYDQTGGKDVIHDRITFLWDKKRIDNSNSNKQYRIEGNAQDVQTFLLQIMYDLQQHQNTMTYFIADRHDATTYVLTQNGSQTIQTPYKKLETIELVSNKLKDSDQYRVWCAVALDFMPVRIQKIDRKGNKTEFIIKSFKAE